MSAVYGPTTVDRQNGDVSNGLSNSSLRYISSLTRVKKHQVVRSLPVVIAVVCFIIGLSLMFVGGLALTSNPDPAYVVLLIIGILLPAISTIFLVLHLKRTGRLYCCNKKTHLDVAGGHVSTNPSTDLLVSATYPPVSDVAYQQAQGDTENSRLMAQENGNISNEDADRMVESDPRIVLRPLKSAHEEC